jgi:hypothetical protein
VACETALYLLSLWTLIGILTVMGPEGLMQGNSALLLTTMSATGMFLLRPIPAIVVGLIGVLTFIGTCLSAGLPNPQIAAAAGNWAAAVLTSGFFFVFT